MWFVSLAAFLFLAVSVFAINIWHPRRCIGSISGDLDTEDLPSAIEWRSSFVIHDKLDEVCNRRGTVDDAI
jgi:hypothetical protein